MMQITPVVKQLLIINVLCFVLSQVVPGSYDLLALHYFESNEFKFWQPITHMFMHAALPSYTHILFNMFGLYSFGTALEHYWGGKRFLLFYLICGIGAAIVQMGYNYFEVHQILNKLTEFNGTNEQLWQLISSNMVEGDHYSGTLLYEGNKALFDALKVNETDFKIIFDANIEAHSSCVGASGAIYGLLVAFAFMFPNSELMLFLIPFPIKAKYFVPIMVGFDLMSGVTGFKLFSGGNIAHFAHVGGALTGFILMMIWRNNKFKFNRLN